MNLKGLLTSVIGAVVGLALYPVVQDAATSAAANSTGFAGQILPLVPFFYVITVLIGTAAFIYSHKD